MCHFIIAHHAGVHVCGHLEILRGTNTTTHTGTNSTGLPEGIDAYIPLLDSYNVVEKQICNYINWFFQGT